MFHEAFRLPSPLHLPTPPSTCFILISPPTTFYISCVQQSCPPHITLSPSPLLPPAYSTHPRLAAAMPHTTRRAGPNLISTRNTSLQIFLSIFSTNTPHSLRLHRDPPCPAAVGTLPPSTESPPRCAPHTPPLATPCRDVEHYESGNWHMSSSAAREGVPPSTRSASGSRPL